MGVVKTVHPDLLPSDHRALQTSSPLRGSDAAPDRGGSDLGQLGPQHLRGANGQRCVLPLKVPAENRVFAPVASHFMEGAVERSGAPPEHGKNDRVVIVRQYDCPAMDHPCLLAGDLPDGVAEVFSVIETNGGDEGGDGPDDIRRVEASSHADFEDDDFATLTLENDERDEGERLEISRFDPGGARGAAKDFDGLDQRLLTDGRVPDHPPFPDVDEMRRRIKPGPVAGSIEDRGERGAGRSFAIRPSDDDRAVRAMRISQRAQDRAHPRQARADAASLKRLEPVERSQSIMPSAGRTVGSGRWPASSPRAG